MKILCIISVLVLFFSACSDSSEKNIIGMSLDDLRLERWQKDRDYFTEEAKKLGYTVVAVSSDGDAVKQASDIENLIAQGVKVIVVIPKDGNALSPAIAQARQEGIPILAYDRLINNADISYYISFDLEKVGRIQAEGILDITNKGRFFYLGGSPDDNNAILFKKGSMEILKPYIDREDITLIGEQMVQSWLPDLALPIIENMLTAEKNNVAAIIAANDSISGAAIRALQAQGLAIPVSGQDADLAALQRIAKGEQALTVYKPIRLLATEAAKIAVTLANGEQPIANSSLNNKTKDVPTTFLEPIKVTKENLEETVIADGWVSKEQIYN
ncbi:MAG: D-xylose ABC transporter substrate-binding protein [Brevinema sp.]